MELSQLLAFMAGSAGRGQTSRPTGDFAAWLSPGPAGEGGVPVASQTSDPMEGETAPKGEAAAEGEAGLAPRLPELPVPVGPEEVIDWLATRAPVSEEVVPGRETRVHLAMSPGPVEVDGQALHVGALLVQANQVITTPWRLTASGEMDHRHAWGRAMLAGLEPTARLPVGLPAAPVLIPAANPGTGVGHPAPINRADGPVDAQGWMVTSSPTTKRAAPPVEASERAYPSWSSDRNLWPLQLLWQSDAGGEATIWYRDFQLAREGEAGVLDTLRRYLRAESPGVRRIVINGRTVWSDANQVNQANQERSHAR